MTQLHTQDYILRWQSEACALPLPDYQCPRGGIPLSEVSDEVLINAPPHMLCHMQRTASQGGLQIVSPRQTPFSCMMTRRSGTKRYLGDHDVGHDADLNAKWPTIDGDTLERLLPDQPLPSMSASSTVYDKTRTTPLTKYAPDIADPVVACLVKGRAVIDILRRPDVCGGADEFASLLAEAWGIPVEDILAMESYTLGVDGPLQRHCMKADDVYPVLYAPCHAKKVITAGTSDLDKRVLHSDTAIDWRRLRVFCEAVFYNAMRVERVPYSRLPKVTNPGDSAATANRPGVLTFYPMPCIAWSFAASTFSIMPDASLSRKPRFKLSEEVKKSVARYAVQVTPVAYLLERTRQVPMWQTTAQTPQLASGETVSEAYARLVRATVPGYVRGKTASATVRNFVYEAIMRAPTALSMRLSRYLTITQDEMRIHFQSKDVPDIVIQHLASRFLALGSYMNSSICKEAARRGETGDEWWDDFSSQLPRHYAVIREGNMAWTLGAFWMIFNEPTEKWGKLRTAVKYEALRNVEIKALGTAPLPADLGSMERVVRAAQITVKRMADAYSGHYGGVVDVAHALSLYATQLSRPRTAAILLEAAHLWALRARVLRALNVHPIAKSEITPSINHLRISADPVDLVLKPAPYKNYESWKKHALASSSIPPYVKKVINDYTDEAGKTRVMAVFTKITRPIQTCPKSTVTRFLLDPPSLSRCCETSWTELTRDVREVLRVTCVEPLMAREEPAPSNVIVHTEVPMITLDEINRQATAGQANSYDSWISLMDYDEVEVIEDALDSMPDSQAEMLMERQYASMQELKAVILGEEVRMRRAKAALGETTR